MRLAATASLLSTAIAFAQQHTIVPAALATADGPGQLWIAGAAVDLRQQVLIDPDHLTTLIGRAITAIEFRRNVADEVYAPGACQMVVTLSTIAAPARHAQRMFATNIGSNAMQVFAGTVTLPMSPGATTVPPWTAPDTVRIPFSTPFAYGGDTLSIDLIGTAIAGQETGWWMADAAFEAVHGTTQQLGNGCGTIGGQTAHWSHVDPHTLVAGTAMRFEAQGNAGELALLILGMPTTTPLPLWLLGLPGAPGCECQLDPARLMGNVLAVFSPSTTAGFAASLGIAEVSMQLPGSAQFLGTSFGSQWLSLPGFTTSNGIACTIAGSIPTLGMALVQGDPLEPVGDVAVQQAPVVRLEHH